jgi:hypothetical protein
MKTQKCLRVFTFSILIIAVSISLIWTTQSLGTSVFGQNVTGNLTNITTTANQPSPNEGSSALRNLIVENAEGTFTSLQTDLDNKTWITTGEYEFASDPTNTSQSNSSTTQFNATIDMKGTDNSGAHEHEISEFKLINSSFGSSNEGTNLTFNGTASIETDVGLYSEVPISIRFIDGAPAIVSIDTQTNEIRPQWVPGGGTIILSIDERVQDHFGNTPVYGGIKEVKD